MGLDIYAGTLTRYYSHNWKTVVQQWAEGLHTSICLLITVQCSL